MNFQKKVLYIENDLSLIKKIEKDLSSERYEVCVVRNGIEGIKKAFEYNPDIIVCSITMEPIGGFQIHEILKQSYLTDGIPFIFTNNNNSEQSVFRKAMNAGADDCLIKPFDITELRQAIENKLLKFKKLKEQGKREYKKLSEISPNGIFIFDGHLLLEANAAFLKMFRISDEDVKTFTLAEFLETHSLQKVKEHISQCTHGFTDSFHEEVTFTLRSGETFEGTLYICIFEKYTGFAHMTGLVIPNNSGRDQNGARVSGIQDILKNEKINGSGSLDKKLDDVFKKNNNHIKNNLKDLFSNREKEVICLSMEGHSTKIIADKLSISDRTVEKHRAKLMEKTSSNNMIEVIVYSLRNNLINLQ